MAKFSRIPRWRAICVVEHGPCVSLHSFQQSLNDMMGGRKAPGILGKAKGNTSARKFISINMKLMSKAIRHIAGEYQDGIQACILCGEVIIDDRGAECVKGQERPGGFEPGVVVKMGNATFKPEDPDDPDFIPCWPLEDA